MRRRTLGTGIFLSVILASTGQANAGGALLSTAATTPVEQRVAVASGPDRTTLWTSLRLEADAGPLALVIPVPPGASLDMSTDAWFEALEVATATRVFPPEGVSSTCPGSKDPGDPFHITGSLAHDPSLLPTEVKVLADADAVSMWAGAHALTLPDDTKAQLSAMTTLRFFTVRFEAAGQSATTKTLRIVMPGAVATLPLALTRAGDKDLKVTTWLIGPGLGNLGGAKTVDVPEATLGWNAKTSESSYASALADALSQAGPSGAALECAGHDPLSINVPINSGKASISSVITALFERAASYGDGAAGTDACVAQAAAALASATPVAASCPRADLGVVDGSNTCTESPGGLTDPAALRCGDGADDLAIALSGLVPAEARLTRRSMQIPKGAAGAAWAITFAAGEDRTPVMTAGSVDMSTCGSPDAGPSGSSSSSSTSGSSGSSGSTTGGSSGVGNGVGNGSTDDYVGSDVGCDCSGTADTVEFVDTPVDSEDDPDTYDSGGDDCSGDTSSSGDDCSGDTSSSSGDDCSGDTSGSSSDSCSGDGTSDGSDNCTGDTSSSDSCDGSSSGGDTSCDSGSSGSDTSCNTGSSSSEDCSIGTRSGGAKRRSPKLSVMTLAFAALLMPLRRAGTRRRLRGDDKNDKKKAKK